MAVRKIIRIDESKCDGCGLCVPSCAEGAIRIVDGKARLVSETYCDGLGACLGECPRGAISMEDREAEAFDQEAAERHVKTASSAPPSGTAALAPRAAASHGQAHSGGCPGAAARALLARESAVPPDSADGLPEIASRLGNWPVQLMLLPVRAPFYQGADVLVAADCVPFAYADFHRRFLTGKAVAVGCPKLDDVSVYREKLVRIFSENDIRSVHVVFMEVPCCSGLVHLVREALAACGKAIPASATRISLRGEILSSGELARG